jgi:excisionase family DNA binding protein
VAGAASMSSSTEIADAYRKAELRLRLLLLGDGADTPPLVKGEVPRQRVTTEIKHLRNAFDALLEQEHLSRAEVAEAAIALENELASIASLRAEAQRASETSSLMTAAEAAAMLGVSPSSLYRAIRRGDIATTRRTGTAGGVIRIPRAEILRLLDSSAGAAPDDQEPRGGSESPAAGPP